MKTIGLKSTLIIATITLFTACKKEEITAKTAVADQTQTDIIQEGADAKTIYLNSTVEGQPQIQSIDIESKTVNWTFMPQYVEPGHTFLDFYDVVPLVSNDTLIYGGPNVFKINKNTGAFIDSFKYVEYNDYLSNAVYYSASVGAFKARKRIVYIANNHLISKDEAGITVWDKQPKVSYGSAPVVEGDNLFVSDYKRIVCLNPFNGAERWHYAALKPLRSNALCVAAGNVYAVDEEANIYAVNATSGAMAWQQKYGTATGGGSGLPAQIAYYDGNIYLVTSGVIRCLNAATGNEVWHSNDAIFGQNSFCIYRSVVYIAGYTTGGDTYSNMFAINAYTGSIYWQNSDYSYDGISPVQTGSILYCSYTRPTSGPTQSGLAAINKNTGQTKWKYIVNGHAHSFTLETLQGKIIYPIDSGEIN